MAEVYYKDISGGLMQLRLEILQRFIPSLLVGTEADEAGDLEEVYSKFISGGQMQLRLEILQRLIISLLVVCRCS